MRCLVALSLILIGHNAAAQSAAIKGTVSMDSSGRPVAAAEIAIPSLNLQTISDTAGTYLITGIIAGTHTVTVKKLGFSPISKTIVVNEGDILTQSFIIPSRRVELDTVVIRERPRSSARMREFEERRNSGFGHFVTRAELAKAEARRTSDIIARLPGADIARGNAGAAWVAGSRGPTSLAATRLPGGQDRGRGAGARCYSDVWLDGILVYGGRIGEPLFDVNQISAANIEAIEFYAGSAQVPTKFNRPGAVCGVLIIWSRES